MIEAAQKKECVLITTPYDSFTTARLIHQSMPIRYFMTKENLITFEPDDYVDDVKETMSKIRHRDFPILDEQRHLVGMMSRRNLLNMKKKQLILVDHNERTQAVDGIEQADILEIIDHHRLGSLETFADLFQNQRWAVRRPHLSDVSGKGRGDQFADRRTFCALLSFQIP